MSKKLRTTKRKMSSKKGGTQGTQKKNNPFKKKKPISVENRMFERPAKGPRRRRSQDKKKREEIPEEMSTALKTLVGKEK